MAGIIKIVCDGETQFLQLDLVGPIKTHQSIKKL